MWTFIVLLLIARYVISKNVVHSHRSASPTSMLPLKVANKLFWILTSWLFTPPKNNISNPFPQVVTFSCTIWHPQRWKQLKICQLKFLYGGRGSERPLRTWNSANHNLLGCSQSVSFFFVLFCSNIFTIYRSSRCFVPESWPSGSVFDSLRWSETEPNAATRRSDTPDPLLTHSQQMKTSTRHGSTMWHSGAIELVNKPHPHPPGSLGEKRQIKHTQNSRGSETLRASCLAN